MHDDDEPATLPASQHHEISTSSLQTTNNTDETGNDAKSKQDEKKVNDSSCSFRARARWAILRQALLSQPSSSSRQPNESQRPSSNIPDVSIHRFPGFQMLQRKPLDLQVKLSKVLFKQLQQIPNGNLDKNLEMAADWLEAGVLALECCHGHNNHEPFLSEVHDLGWDEAHVRLLQETLRPRGVMICQAATAKGHTHYSVSMQPSSTHQPDTPKRQRAFEYRLPTTVENGEANSLSSSIQIVTREPEDHANSSNTATTHPRLDLTQLASQRYYDGIDNTGNICVWDSSRTCAWLVAKCCLMEDPNGASSPICRSLGIHKLWDLATNVLEVNGSLERTTAKPRCLKVLELGAGMAGLPSLALAAIRGAMVVGRDNDNHELPSVPIVHITISDGHPNAVRNNRVNALLTLSCLPSDTDEDETTRSSSYVTIDCQRCLWTKEATTGTHQHDLVIVCDCTHFEEYHEELLMTILSNLRLGGVALLCQPPRGQSLSRFLSHVESCQLMEIQFVEIPELVQQHEHWMQQQQKQQLNRNDATELYKQAWYDPSIHCPQVVLLRKISESQRRAQRVT